MKKQQLVDPFIPASRPTAPSARPAKPTTTPPVAKPSVAPVRRAGSIDGMVRPSAGVRSVPAAKPTAAYRPPAGPLHVHYAPKPASPAKTMNVRPGVTAVAQPAAVRPGVVATPGVERPSRALADRPASSSATAKQEKPVAKPRTKRRFQSFSIPGIITGLLLVGVGAFSSAAGQLILLVYAILTFWRRWPSQQTFGLALLMFVAIIGASLVEPVRHLADNLAVYAFLLLCIGTISLAWEVRRDD